MFWRWHLPSTHLLDPPPPLPSMATAVSHGGATGSARARPTCVTRVRVALRRGCARAQYTNQLFGGGKRFVKTGVPEVGALLYGEKGY